MNFLISAGMLPRIGLLWQMNYGSAPGIAADVRKTKRGVVNEKNGNAHCCFGSNSGNYDYSRMYARGSVLKAYVSAALPPMDMAEGTCHERKHLCNGKKENSH